MLSSTSTRRWAATFVLCLAGCSSAEPLTLRGSDSCPPAAGSVERWCDDAGDCELRVTTGGVFSCRAGAACTTAAADAAAVCRAGGLDGPDGSVRDGSAASACETSVACVSDGPPAYVIADWQVRCDSVMGMCTVPLARSLTGEDGRAGNVVSCRVTETATERSVVMTAGGLAADGSRFEVQVMSARFPRAGGSASGGGCSTVVTEGANRFAGPCGGMVPSMEQPCQITAEFGYDTEVRSPTATLRILCDHLSNEASIDDRRSLSFPESIATPAEFVFFSCRGQTAD